LQDKLAHTTLVTPRARVGSVLGTANAVRAPTVIKTLSFKWTNGGSWWGRNTTATTAGSTFFRFRDAGKDIVHTVSIHTLAALLIFPAFIIVTRLSCSRTAVLVYHLWRRTVLALGTRRIFLLFHARNTKKIAVELAVHSSRTATI
jgi:hypothetical protein